MEENRSLADETAPRAPTGRTTRREPTLRWRLVTVMLAVSLLPLVIVGAGSWVVFGRLLDQKAFEQQRTLVERHSYAIEAYLEERVRLLRILAGTRDLQEIANAATLRHVFERLNEATSGGFVDLGVISARGGHLAYVGPYDLADKNYEQAEWFHEVMAGAVFVSDVFPGFRQIPHCIIAVRAGGDEEPWLLRATIDSEQFDHLVSTDNGVTGTEAFIVNRRGEYQTRPGHGAVLDHAPIAIPAYHAGVRDDRVLVDGKVQIMVTTWINGGRWLLVVLQDAARVRAPVIRALSMGAVVVLTAFLLVVATTVLATRHLTRQIDRANHQREEMFHAFLRSARLASLGELASGLAHEINNPLAIMSAQQTNVSDLLTDLSADTAGISELRDSVESTKRQIKRCGGITAKMLQFARKQESTLLPTDIAPRLQEIVSLMTQQAKIANVDLVLEADDDLPPVMVDPIELEQVLVNLIKNALDAMPDGGTIQVRAVLSDDAVHIEVEDDGPGILPEHLGRIFEPFFTTKPVGQGTGLGLSVCYGLVRSWGGQITAESPPGRGTTMRIRLPVQPDVPEQAPVPGGSS